MKRPVCTLVLIAGISLFYSAAQYPVPPTHYAVGDTADDFSLRNIDGRMISLGSYPHAKGFIVIFTCNHCPYAQLYEQRIIDLHRKFNPKGFPVIAINPNDPKLFPDDSFEEMQRRATDKQYPFVYLFDSTQTVYPLFGARRTPHVYVLDQKRIVRYIGAIDDKPENPAEVTKRYVEDAVNALLRGERPDPEFTLAIGCPIRKKR